MTTKTRKTAKAAAAVTVTAAGLELLTVPAALSRYYTAAAGTDRATDALAAARANVGTSRVLVLLAIAAAGAPVTIEAVQHAAAQANRPITPESATARCSEFNTAAKLAERIGAQNACALLSDAWNASDGIRDRPAAVLSAVRAALKGDAQDASELAAGSVERSRDAERARAEARAVPKLPKAPAAEKLTPMQACAQHLSAALVDLQHVGVKMLAEKAKADAIAAVQHAQLLLAQVAMLAG